MKEIDVAYQNLQIAYEKYMILSNNSKLKLFATKLMTNAEYSHDKNNLVEQFMAISDAVHQKMNIEQIFNGKRNFFIVSVRHSIIYIVMEELRMKFGISELAKLTAQNHATLYHTLKKVKTMLYTKDKKFLTIYNIVKPIVLEQYELIKSKQHE